MLNIDKLHNDITMGTSYYWKSTRYKVIVDKLNRVLVVDQYNGYTTGLHPNDLADVFC